MAPLLLNNKKPKIKGDFIVPDYYKDFQCKGKDCKNTCCSGWIVTIPMDEYFKLHGIDCESKLKDKIDRAFRPVYSPTLERYAEMVNNFRGDCPLLMENGYCQLHFECGEEALPSVCRTYPRSIKKDYALEASCSNSCEKTLEMLVRNDLPIIFEKQLLNYYELNQQEKKTEAEQFFYIQLRDVVFNVLSNRNYSLQRRIIKIGELFMALDIDSSSELYNIEWNDFDLKKTDFEYSINTIKNITEWYKENNRNLADMLLEIEEYYGNNKIMDKYLFAVKHFEELIPNHEIIMEKFLINHLFFRQFPFQPYFKTFYDEFIGLSGLYLILRYTSVALMVKKNTLADYIDIMAKLFRVISHSKFEYNISVLLKNEISTDFTSITNLITI